MARAGIWTNTAGSYVKQNSPWQRFCCWLLGNKHSCGSFEGKSAVVSRGHMWLHLRPGNFQFLCAPHGDQMVPSCCFPSIWCFTELRSHVLLKENRMKKNTCAVLCCLGWILYATLLLKNKLILNQKGPNISQIHSRQTSYCMNSWANLTCPGATS